ncbi:class I SAM-dependent methyltransferase [Apilactobacillus sp. TMW 2.2459]|uniref:class I SAM-dependent methyltransferase n=1 Tax=Apilactobacillus xinyiensis TaxID=2841032 RepID=UPI00200C2CD0|nr:class I SAM-dependent methyltransferase [Apilactobacillus xinyiensis]MCL0312111.1 class I SAM-dependent methyltransferase [Apilactobacillus xinyiensis]
MKKFNVYKSNNKFVERIFLASAIILFATYFFSKANSTFLCFSIIFLLLTLLSWLRNCFLRNRLFKEFIDSIELFDNSKILDLGSGNGDVIIRLASRLTMFSNVSIFAVEDIYQTDNDFMYNALNNRVRYRIELSHKDIRKLDYDEESFDIITASNNENSLLNSHKKSDYKSICKEINRLLKPGGIAYIFNNKYTSKKMANEFINQDNKVFFYDYKFQPLYGVKIFSVEKKNSE